MFVFNIDTVFKAIVILVVSSGIVFGKEMNFMLHPKHETVTKQLESAVYPV